MSGDGEVTVRLTEAEREELGRLFGYVPEPEPLEQMLAAVERIVGGRVDLALETIRELRAEQIEWRRLTDAMFGGSPANADLLRALGIDPEQVTARPLEIRVHSAELVEVRYEGVVLVSASTIAGALAALADEREVNER